MRTAPLKHVVDINRHTLAEDCPGDFEFRYLDISTVGPGHLLGDPQWLRFEDAPSRARRLVCEGDTIVSTVRTYLRAVLPVTRETADVVVSTGFAVLSPRSVEARYLGWLAQSSVFIDEVVARSVGVSYPAINPSDLGRIRIPVPNKIDQQAIADFLDAETARLDHLIAQKRRLVALLHERIDSELRTIVGASHLVDDAGTTDAWPIRRLLRKVTRAGQDGDMITAFRDGQVTARALRRAEGYTESWTEAARVQGVVAGDIVVHGLDGFAGAIGTAEVSGVCSPVYHVCVPEDGGDSHFYGRLLRLLAVEGYLSLFASSTRERAVDFRNWDLFGRIPIPRVHLADQRRIGEQIRRLAPLEVAVERSAELVAERKQALISAAVTGQLALAREIAVEES